MNGIALLTVEDSKPILDITDKGGLSVAILVSHRAVVAPNAGCLANTENTVANMAANMVVMAVATVAVQVAETNASRIVCKVIAMGNRAPMGVTNAIRAALPGAANVQVSVSR